MKIKYNVNKDKRAIAAYFDDNVVSVINNAIESITDGAGCRSGAIIRINAWTNGIAERKLRGYKMFGIARCGPEDTFDEEIGKRIARERLLKQWSAYKVDVVETYRRALTSNYIEVNKALLRLEVRNGNDR